MTNVRVIVAGVLGVVLLGALVVVFWPRGAEDADPLLDKMIQLLDENAKQLDKVTDLLEDGPSLKAHGARLARIVKQQKQATLDAAKRRESLGSQVPREQAARLDAVNERSAAAIDRLKARLKARFGEQLKDARE